VNQWDEQEKRRNTGLLPFSIDPIPIASNAWLMFDICNQENTIIPAYQENWIPQYYTDLVRRSKCET